MIKVTDVQSSLISLLAVPTVAEASELYLHAYQLCQTRFLTAVNACANFLISLADHKFSKQNGDTLHSVVQFCDSPLKISGYRIYILLLHTWIIWFKLGPLGKRKEVFLKNVKFSSISADLQGHGLKFNEAYSELLAHLSF